MPLQHLLVIQNGRRQRQLTLNAPIYSIGRDPRCDIHVLSQFVSRRHATLIQLPNEDGSLYYRIVDGDLKGRRSGNGLLVNRYKLLTHDLRHQDEVILAPEVKLIYYRLDRSLHELEHDDLLRSTARISWQCDPDELDDRAVGY